MKRIPLKFIIAVIVFTESVFGWGKTGHRIIGMVAENYLSEVAKIEIKKLFTEILFSFLYLPNM